MFDSILPILKASVCPNRKKEKKKHRAFQEQ